MVLKEKQGRNFTRRDERRNFLHNSTKKFKCFHILDYLMLEGFDANVALKSVKTFSRNEFLFYEHQQIKGKATLNAIKGILK